MTKRILLAASALLFLSGCAGNEAVVKKPAAPAEPTTAATRVAVPTNSPTAGFHDVRSFIYIR